ncbi:unnamed protein product [Rotaria sp. Silwood1]|nr:unnamed protein product [Rotaria sp. Silwood1]
MTINNNPDRRNLYSQQTSTISNDFTPAQNAVLNLLKTVTSMTDYSVTEICKQLKQFNEYQVKQALEFLSGEGYILFIILQKQNKMDLDPMINTSQDENNYSDYDNRPIRPMDQDALNEALARLPILIDEDDSTRNSDSNTSIKLRRQPVLAYSTRRKNFSGVNINQTVLNVTETPTNNKRKLGGCTPTNKFIKQIDARQDLMNLKEENKILEEVNLIYNKTFHH